MKRILCFSDCYLPGYRAGGPIRTIANMVESLGDEFHFFIVTRDRDFKSSKPYLDVEIDGWNTVGKASVYYASPMVLGLSGIKRLLGNVPHDVLYLNSFFSARMTVLPMLIRLFGLYRGKSVIIAPRGEFSAGALALKSKKKAVYISLAKAIGLYRDVIWQASTNREAEDIYRVLGGIASQIKVAPNLLPLTHPQIPNSATEGCKNIIGCLRKPGPLRIVFLSRISPMKNLEYLLKILGSVNAPLQLTIYGTLEDVAYWTQCQSLIRKMPRQISVQYLGEVTPEHVSQAFSKHDVFIFPTRGENFGHVIFEALSTGTPVIVSDQTPWRQDVSGAVQVLSLEQPNQWIFTIRDWANFSDEQLSERRTAAMNYADAYVRDSNALQLNRDLFSHSRLLDN